MQRTKPITEAERTSPSFSSLSPGLALGKRVLEMLTRQYCEKGYINASVARCFGFIGPGLPTNLHYAAGNFISSAVTGKDIEIKGDGKPIRSFMYLGDLVYWLMTILLYGENGEDYNVGSTKAVSIKQLAEIIRNEVNKEVRVVTLGKTNSTPGNPDNHFYVPDTSKARLMLGLNELTSLKEATRLFSHFEYNKNQF